VDELLKRGWVCHCLHRPGSKRAAMLDQLPHAAHGRLVHVEGDLAYGADFVALVPEDTEVIFHICHVEEREKNPDRGLTAPGFQPEGAQEHKQLNRDAMTNVIEAAKARRVHRVVYCSSWSAYGCQPSGTDVNEHTRSLAHAKINAKCCGCCCGPASSPVPYFECKLELEEQLRASLADGVHSVIIQPCSVFGRYGETGWCTIFNKLLQGPVPGLPGSSSFVDVQDLASVFVAAVDEGPGDGEAYIIGGTNATNLEMQRQMAMLVDTPAPSRVTPGWVLRGISRWNEMLLGSRLGCLRIKADVIGSPWLISKMTQDQSAQSAKAQDVLGYRPRPLAEILRRNYDWLVSAELLPQANRKAD